MPQSRHDINQRIREERIIAIVRLDDADKLKHVAQAIHAGGLSIIEFTLTTPGALEVIRDITNDPDTSNILIGAGSVLDAETARAAILAGAQFIVAPGTNEATITMAHRYGKPIIPGAYTPTEIQRAMELGADFIKVFPANNLGPAYIKTVLAPLPQADLIPTGGITLDNAPDYFQAGAAALALSSSLIDPAALQANDYATITKAAKKFHQLAQEHSCS